MGSIQTPATFSIVRKFQVQPGLGPSSFPSALLATLKALRQKGAAVSFNKEPLVAGAEEVLYRAPIRQASWPGEGGAWRDPTQREGK